MVQMPVRVKPPPAEIGEIISPGWAFLEVTMPANGARMIVSSICCCHMLDLRSATVTSALLLLQARLEATSHPTSARSKSACVRDVVFCQVGRALQLLSSASFSRARVSSSAFFADSNWASATRRLVLTFVSSSRANTWPSFTFIPSSTSTSMTLPVTLEETVASRRAVT